MKKAYTALCIALLLAVQPIGAQSYQSTVCHDDGTVTFQYRNDHAREVLVDVQFAGRHAMQRDAAGLWSVTLGPAAPDLYPYCFIVDGVSIMDPQCDGYFPNEGFKNSLLSIPSPTGPLLHDDQAPRHGTVEYLHYYSKSLGATNNAVVYLPPGYGLPGNEKRYPVFYLISGTTDTDEVYYKVGRVNYILDNLLAEGAAQEMIVVLPYGNPYKLLPVQPEIAGVPQTQFGNDVFSLDLLNDLMPLIERQYRTIADRDHRAIGGFSRGGNQALMNGLSHLDRFSYLCSYSSFTTTDLPAVYDHADETNSKIHLFWLGVGTDDFLYGTARDYMEFLDKKGIRSVKEFTHDKFGHTWMNARYFLDKTLRLLFNEKASAEAMRHGQPALAATGKEQQFTPGVMARLFPKPIISPEYTANGIIFRFKAPDAKEVLLCSELTARPLAMQKDADGVWTLSLDGHKDRPFTYCFVVDGTPVADPNNMYLSPAKGFKPSIALHTASRYHFASMGEEVRHGTVSYDLQNGEAWYRPATDCADAPVVQLVPGRGDTLESWFKVGGADALADRLIAEGKTRPCCLTTSALPHVGSTAVHTLKADDYPTWAERQAALEKLLLNLK